MDRFIDSPLKKFILEQSHLKSNMDRFIDGKGSKQRVVPLFKIQYG